MKRIAILAALSLAIGMTALAAQTPTVSEKKDIAVFSLGYYGWNIPLEALHGIDANIQQVFVNLGRFNVIGMTQKLSSQGLDQFIAAVKKAKEADFVLPEKYQFGEAVFTEADFNRLLGAFIVAAPVVTSFSSNYDSQASRWESELKTSVTLLDVATGAVIGVVSETTTGYDKDDQYKSMTAAIDSIPSSLEYNIRAMPAFQISTRVLAVSQGEVKLQLGTNMGIVKGDEYAIVTPSTLEGIAYETETGLILIKDVGREISTAVVLYSDGRVGPNSQLREIPRVGGEGEIFAHGLLASPFVLSPGLRILASRGFYGFRPFVGAQLPIGPFSMDAGLPFNAFAGGQYDLHLGRITLSPYAAGGATLLYSGDDAKTVCTHAGAEAYFQISYLMSRDARLFIEAGGEYWLGLYGYASYGGIGCGAGATLKY